ncbi:Intron-binding protein aquarius [Echinococcus granulosus]|uniref:Intron-binding protein aquarius n=1 Tax=Echinococcus granulosus TaxID=6210 RepID=W6VA23_ECHGR|nr:Intron-binding protein aquarius [Echinococcus granulosus]EUB63584.1 Intron-binding protein aquarius [Echinococcus granulosus]
MMLELAQYLECWLWPNFDEKSSRAHIISICVMVNEKARERVPIWQDLDPLLAHYLHRSLLLLIDLSSMLMTRRFLMILMDDRHTVIRCQNCVLYKAEGKKEGCLFSELVDILTFYAQFQVDSTTGEAVDAIELDRRHNS